MVQFETQITTKDMFDYNIYHNYRNFQGIISLIMGVVLLVLCFFAVKQDANVSYILITGFLGLFFTIITPVRIYFKSFQQVKLTPSFKKPISYTLTDGEITVSQDDAKAVIPLNEIMKVCDTGKSIILYVTGVRAYIFPKRDIGGQLDELVTILKNSSIKKVKL